MRNRYEQSIHSTVAVAVGWGQFDRGPHKRGYPYTAMPTFDFTLGHEGTRNYKAAMILAQHLQEASKTQGLLVGVNPDFREAINQPYLDAKLHQDDARLEWERNAVVENWADVPGVCVVGPKRESMTLRSVWAECLLPYWDRHSMEQRTYRRDRVHAGVDPAGSLCATQSLAGNRCVPFFDFDAVSWEKGDKSFEEYMSVPRARSWFRTRFYEPFVSAASATGGRLEVWIGRKGDELLAAIWRNKQWYARDVGGIDWSDYPFLGNLLPLVEEPPAPEPVAPLVLENPSSVPLNSQIGLWQ